jgi:3-hydroxybutyrate dehydrogenase
MLEKRVALITGATSGIGLTIARTIAKGGATIGFSGLGTSSDLDSITSELATVAADVRYLAADARHGTALEAMVGECESIFGAVDILINCAGLQHVAPIEEFPPERWNAIIAVNLTAAYHTVRAALPGMRQRNWGRIINIASVHGLVGSAHKCAYVAAKHGLVGLTKVVALETARSPITCNAICPGWVLTPLVRDQVEVKAREKGLSIAQATSALLAEKQPSGAFVDAQQIADLVMFLCGPSATEIRGSAWTIDGGWTAQ